MFARPQTGRIAIRVSAGTQLGMGHLVRCSHLAKVLLAQGLQVYFVLDQYMEALQAWLAPFKVHSLYADAQFANQQDDASATLALLQEGDWLLVDDYRLDAVWHTPMRRKAERIIVIDDLANRKHDCDVLIDYRWCADNRGATRYQELVPEHCQQLLGPDYCLLAPEYKDGVDIQTRSTRNFAERPFTVLLSLGGGGDASLLAALLQTLLAQTATANQNIQYWAVAGTLSAQTNSLDMLAETHSNLSILRGHNNLARFYREADLFIGASGTSIYEINATCLPSITFSLTDNQNNESADLDDLGLFMHLAREEFLDGQAMANLLTAIKTHYPRVCKLLSLRKIEIDAAGCERVAAQLLGAGQSAEPVINKKQAGMPRYQQELKPGIVIREIDDSEVNRYLDARNLELNRKRMSVNNLVRRVDHYRWWLENTRATFVLERDAQTILYIWHQGEHFEGQHYLIGGWIVASEACSFDLTALALSWQLRYCEQQHPEATWVAIINKDNRFVNLLNSLYGFKDVAVSSPEARAIEHFFPKANREQFNYVACTPSSLPLEVAL